MFTDPLPQFKLKEKDTHRYGTLPMDTMPPRLRLRIKFLHCAFTGKALRKRDSKQIDYHNRDTFLDTLEITNKRFDFT